jgi:hypothetical protein
MLSIPISNTLNIPSGLSLTNNGIINTISNNAQSKSNMVSRITSRGKNGDNRPCECTDPQFLVNGTFNNESTCSLDSYVINTGATGINGNGGTITVVQGACIINNYGYSVNNGTIDSRGCSINTGTAYNNYIFNNFGSSYNYGTSTNGDGAYFTSYGILSNESSGIYYNDGVLNCNEQTVKNAGQWNNTGSLFVNSNFSNSGIFSNNSSGQVGSSADFSNTSQVYNSGNFYGMTGSEAVFSFKNQSNGTLYNTNFMSPVYLNNSGIIYNYGGTGQLNVAVTDVRSFNNGTIVNGPTGTCGYGFSTTVSGAAPTGGCPPAV